MILSYRKKNKINLIQEINAYYKENVKALYSFTVWACGNEYEAENVLKHALERVEKDIHSKKGIRNIKYNFLRALHVRCNDEKSSSTTQLMDIDEQVEDSFKVALSKVPEKYSLPLVMQVVGKFSITEISYMLLTSEGEIATHLSAARRMVSALAALEQTISSTTEEIKTNMTPAKSLNHLLVGMDSQNLVFA